MESSAFGPVRNGVKRSHYYNTINMFIPTNTFMIERLTPLMPRGVNLPTLPAISPEGRGSPPCFDSLSSWPELPTSTERT